MRILARHRINVMMYMYVHMLLIRITWNGSMSQITNSMHDL